MAAFERCGAAMRNGRKCARKNGHKRHGRSPGHRSDKAYAANNERRSRYAHSPDSTETAAWKRKRRKERRMWLGLLKLAYGCADCGYREHAEALEWDHLPGFEKAGNVSRLYVESAQKLFAEIAKCEVVCSNCHHVRTARRRND